MTSLPIREYPFRTARGYPLAHQALPALRRLADINIIRQAAARPREDASRRSVACPRAGTARFADERPWLLSAELPVLLWEPCPLRLRPAR